MKLGSEFFLGNNFSLFIKYFFLLVNDLIFQVDERDNFFGLDHILTMVIQKNFQIHISI